jgi:hypothetical protein
MIATANFPFEAFGIKIIRTVHGKSILYKVLLAILKNNRDYAYNTHRIVSIHTMYKEPMTYFSINIWPPRIVNIIILP